MFVNNEAQFQVLLAFFSNKRYNRIHNKHLFLVYRASRLPDDPRATSALWRQLAQRQGLDGLYLVKLESLPSERNRHPKLDSFDAALDWGSLPPPLQPSLR